MSIICREFLLKLALRSFLKPSRASTLSVWTEEIQAKSEEWTTQTAINRDTLWLQTLGTRNSSLANTKMYMLLYRVALFYFVFERTFQVQVPGGLYSEGRFNGGVFVLRVWGVYICRGLFIHGGAYIRNFTVYYYRSFNVSRLKTRFLNILCQ